MKKIRLEVFPATEEGFAQLLEHCRLSDDLWRAVQGRSLFQILSERIGSDEPIWEMFLSAKPWKYLCKVLFIQGSICILERWRRISKICQVRECHRYSRKHLLPFIYHIPYFIQAGWEPYSLSVDSVYLRKGHKILEFYGYQTDSKIWLHYQAPKRFRLFADLIYSSYYKIPLLPPAELLAAIESGNLPPLPEPELTGTFSKFDYKSLLNDLTKKEES
jgi:hypothetical protein